jgi:hypothetical protein
MEAQRGRYDAIACVEVIEHLPSEADAHRAGAVLLCGWAPRIAVVTTPNVEANAALEAAACSGPLAADEHGARGRFRDADHKFEWTRAQFQDWAHRAVAAAGGAYDVSFAEVGALRAAVQPAGSVPMGASQAAVFVRRDAALPPPQPASEHAADAGGHTLVWTNAPCAI